MSAVVGIKIREFARRDGCDDKLVRRAIGKGKLKTLADGTLDESLVGTAWREANRRAQPQQPADRGADTAADTPAPVRTVVKNGRQAVERPDPAAIDPPPPDIATLQEFIDKILSGEFVTEADAIKVKENGLALKHLLAAQLAAGDVVPLEVAQGVLFETQRAQRDVWLNFPTKAGPLIAADLGIDADRLIEALHTHVHQQCSDLGEPEADFGGPSGKG